MNIKSKIRGIIILIFLLSLTFCGCAAEKTEIVSLLPTPKTTFPVLPSPRKDILATPSPTQNNGQADEAIVYVPDPIPKIENVPVPLSKPDLIETPNSTCFEYVGYDVNDRLLCVIFRDSKMMYYYENVPYELWRDFVNASSLGGFYNEYIKPEYDYSYKEYVG